MHELNHKEHEDSRKASPLAHLAVGLLIGVAATFGIMKATDKPAATASPTASGDSMSQMVEGLRDKSGDDFDRAFIEAMIPHHQSAVQMAQLINDRAKHDEVKQLGKDIIAAQNGEIDRMKGWYAEWGFGTYGDMPGMDHGSMH